MENQRKFLGRDTYRHNYMDEPGKVVVNPNPGIPGHRYPKEFFSGENVDLAFPGMDEQAILKFLDDNRYQMPRKIADGSWSALFMLATTWSICTDITKNSPYAYRWCFTDRDEALLFLETMTEFDEVPKSTNSLRGHRFESGYARVIHYGMDGFRKW